MSSASSSLSSATAPAIPPVLLSPLISPLFEQPVVLPSVSSAGLSFPESSDSTSASSAPESRLMAWIAVPDSALRLSLIS